MIWQCHRDTFASRCNFKTVDAAPGTRMVITATAPMESPPRVQSHDGSPISFRVPFDPSQSQEAQIEGMLR
jgi:hypothetical protein